MKGLFKNKKILIIVAAVLLVLVVAAAVVLFLMRDKLFGPKEPPVEEAPTPIEAPVHYVLGEERILAIPAGNQALVYEGEQIFLAQQVADLEAEEAGQDQEEQPAEEPEEPAEGESADEEEGAEEAAEEEAAPVNVAYRYEEMADAPSMVSAYTALLTTEDMGYQIADEKLKPAEEAPNLTASRGTVYLTRMLPKPEDDTEQQAIAMRIDWERTLCKVNAELVPASITVVPPEPSAPVGGFMQTLTFSSAVDTVKAMHPSTLELEGESMEGYRIYSRDGIVIINDQPCMRLDIYRLDEKIGANVVAGNYFISSDGRRLYIFNEKEQTMRELPMGVA